MLGLILYCCNLEILNNFLTRALHFHFVLDPANYTAGPTFSKCFRMKVYLLECILESALILITVNILELHPYE